jgi:hypothetical protein
MQIQVGDKVQLTASLLMKFQAQEPELYAAMLEAGIHSGTVMQIDSDGICVELQPMKPGYRPMRLTISATNPQLALQVVESKNDNDDDNTETLRLAQWTMTQFLQMKQYAIAQDLMRVPDSRAPGMGNFDPSDEWKNDAKNLRAVQVSLDDEETATYHAALRRLRTILQHDVKAPTHPECKTSTD